MEINKLYITINKSTNRYSIDKIIEISDVEYISNDVEYISNYVSLEFHYYENSIFGINEFNFIPLNEYFQNPNKYPQFNYDQISKMWKKFMENDIVEARKFKLKLLNEYGNK